MKRINFFYEEMESCRLSLDIPTTYLADLKYLSNKKAEYQKAIKVCSKIIEQDFAVTVSLIETTEPYAFCLCPRAKGKLIYVGIRPEYFPTLKIYIENIQISTSDALTAEEIKERQKKEWDSLSLLEKIEVIKELVNKELEKVKLDLEFWNEEV